jgi:hypothetical protein
MYWWRLPIDGEPQARGPALIVLMAGYQLLTFLERLALQGPTASIIPRTRVFWIVWSASAISMVVII